MIIKEITASMRDTFGKGPVGRMRVEGRAPGVVYSGGREALALEFETKVLFQELLDIQGRNAVFTLKIGDSTEKNVVVKEIQTDPQRDTLLHVDFLEIDLQKPSTFEVPIVYSGKAKGEDRGGLKQVDKTSLLVRGKPLDIPDSCQVSITALGIGEKICAGQIGLPEGVTLESDPEIVCVSVTAP